MKKSLLTLAAAAAAIATAPASAAVIVSMNPAVQAVGIGDTITVNLRISGLGSGPTAEILSAFDLNVLFNSSLVTTPGIALTNSEFDPTFFFSTSFASGNSGAQGDSGLVLDDDLAAIQTDDSFVFMNFSWVAAANGALFLNFGADLDFERNVVGRDALSLNATFQGACVAIGTGSCNQVPEPATFALAGLALLGCGMSSAARRRAVPAAVSA